MLDVGMRRGRFRRTSVSYGVWFIVTLFCMNSDRRTWKSTVSRSASNASLGSSTVSSLTVGSATQEFCMVT